MKPNPDTPPAATTAPERAAQARATVMLRLRLGVTGALAGLAFYMLFEFWPETADETVLILASAFLLVLSAATLCMTGPLRPGLAAASGAALATVCTALLWTAGLPFDTPPDALNQPSTMLAFVTLAAVPVPFLLAWGQGRHLDYRALHQHAWSVTVRSGIAVLFTALFWGAVGLSDMLLGMVGIDLLERVWSTEWSMMILTGAALGTGLAVVDELSEYVTPYLAVRLLRLLVPPIAAVMVVFLVAVPLRGLGDVFGSWSTASTLLSITALAALLITATVDEDEARAATHPVLVQSARIMAGCVPVMAALAAWSIWLRLDQHGLTPARLAAVFAAAVALGYGAVYGLAVLRGRDAWRDGVRKGNTIMGLASIGLAALWLSPLIRPESWSTADQIARYEAGAIAADDLPLWSMSRQWGIAGREAVEQLRGRNAPDLVAVLRRLDDADSQWTFDTETEQAQDGDAGFAAVRLVLPPQGADIPDAALAAMNRNARLNMMVLCKREACAVVQRGTGWLVVGMGFMPELLAWTFVQTEPDIWRAAEVRPLDADLARVAEPAARAALDALIAGGITPARIMVDGVRAGQTVLLFPQ